MKRVQMILEDWQHEWLAEEAKREGVSMSALLRELLSQAIEARQTQTLNDDPLWGIIGMAEGPDDGITSENLDQAIYTIPTYADVKLADERTDDY
ncbi:MAG TPA: hypothetical protein ENK60_08995 [Anaerolineae bacterium]|nr:hypothetical protein [Anaerolineae bacterium]